MRPGSGDAARSSVRRVARQGRELLRDGAVQQLTAGGVGVALGLYLQQGHTPRELLSLEFLGYAAVGALGGALLAVTVRGLIRE